MKDRNLPWHMDWLAQLLAILILAVLTRGAPAAEVIPRDALKYQRELTRNARSTWGLDAPVATFAGQVHAESRWRADAKSAYAGGLAQFTPDTAAWISGAYRAELGDNQPFNPTWALRALVVYDKHLWERVRASSECDRFAFLLAAYNGGLGWVERDKKLAATNGADPLTWFGSVERFNAGRAKWAFDENRGYPAIILKRWQHLYAAWGPVVMCG